MKLLLNRLALISFRRTIPKLTFRRNYAVLPERCDAHMNELPIPCGPWDKYYQEKQAYYNKTLAAGALWWLISAALAINEGLFFGFYPPCQPGPPSEAAEEETAEC